jgi:hypothetical protein
VRLRPPSMLTSQLTFRGNEGCFVDQQALGRCSLLVVGDSEVGRCLRSRGVSESRQGRHGDSVDLLLILRTGSELDSLEQTRVGLRGGPLVDGIDGNDHFVIL